MTRLVWAILISVLCALPSSAQTVTEIPLTTNDLVYDPVSARLYASVPSSAGANGNSIAVIDPATGVVERYLPVGSEPNKLAVSDDGLYLYVGIDGEHGVRRVHLPTLTADLWFSLGSESGTACVALDLAVRPGNSRTIAVARGVSLSYPLTAVLYYEGVALPSHELHQGLRVRFVPDGTALMLWGLGFSRVDVTSTGLGQSVGLGYLLPASDPLAWTGNYVYSDHGFVGDPVERRRIAQLTTRFGDGRAVVPDSSESTAFVLLQGGRTYGARIAAYSMETFRPLWFVSVAASTQGNAGDLVLWPDGAAFRTEAGTSSPGQVFIVSIAGTHTLTVGKAGLGNGTISSVPPNITCGDECAGRFAADSQVTLEATPDSASVFLRWEGDADCADGTVSMSAARTCTAVFGPKARGALLTVPLPVNRLAYTPALNRILAAVKSVDPLRGNTVTMIDPETGAIGPSVWVGSEPDRLAVSDDGRTLYVGMSLMGSIRRVDLTTMTAAPAVYLGTDEGWVMAPLDIAVLPGSVSSIAVARGEKEPLDWCPELSHGVVVLDGGVQRPIVSHPMSGPTSLAFSTSATWLYGSEPGCLQKMMIHPTGVSVVGTRCSPSVSRPIVFAGGRLYSSSGQVIDPDTLSEVGKYSIQYSHGVVADLAHNEVHFLVGESSGPMWLRSFDASQFSERRTIALGFESTSPRGLVSSGSSRIAFHAGENGVGLLYLDPNAPHQDMNGDGNPDIVWHNKLTGEILVWNMVGGVRTGTTSVVGCADVNWRLVARADFNSDGRPDFLWRHAVSGLNEIWYMDGATRLGGASLQAVPDPAWRVAGAADFNGDSLADILWRSTTTGEAVVWYMNGAERIGDDTLTPIDPAWHIGGVADFNRDGRPDLVLRNERTGENVVWYMNGVVRAGYERLKNAPAGWSIGDVIDFNLDGHPDLLWRNAATGQNVVWYLDGVTHVSSQVLPDAGAAWSVLQGPAGQGPAATNDFNQDGRPDLLWHNGATGENVLWLMNGTAVSGKPRLPSVSDVNWRPVAVADFNADGKADILWRNTSTGENVVWHMDGSTYVGNQRLATVADPAWEVAGAADFNRDGWADIVWRNQATGENIVWLMTGAQCRQYVRLKSVSDANWVLAATADFTGDGKPDLLWRHQATGENIVWQMDGTTYVGYIRVKNVADPAWQVAMAADFNGDGRTDIVWRNQATGENAVWSMNGAAYVRYERLATVSDTDWRVVR